MKSAKYILILLILASVLPQVALAICVTRPDTISFRPVCTPFTHADSVETEKVCPRVWPLEAQYNGQPWTQNLSSPWRPTNGLSGHHLCLWASHGRYFSQAKGWTWQRPLLYCTTEDLLTPSFVYPFLIPMLERAGAVVWTPRERDLQPLCAIVDSAHETPKSYQWQVPMPASGQYAVYVRYPSLPNAVPDAVYTIHHGGERTRIAVNQRMGANTWVYLGTYFFNEQMPRDGLVELSKSTAYRGRLATGSVRIGGGMGHITRQNATDTLAVATNSGVPHYLEAARYYAEWAGLADSLYNTEAGLDDYKDDLRVRPNFLNHLRDVAGVPFELSLAVHTDAGYRTDSIPYASLAICTTVDGEGRHNYYDIISRQSSHDLAGFLLDQVTNDLEADYRWHSRELRDRNYAETRSPHIPSAIIEMLSHQNFLDARLAHDPVFKFRMSRALYKALLRYSYHVNGLADPIVQPLPVQQFTAVMSGEEAVLSWQATTDTLEPSADATHYIVYTRVDDGDFDNGQLTGLPSLRQRILPGHRYTFRVTAVNQGGESFPSNQLTVYRSPRAASRSLLLVDAFTRLSGPAYVDTPDSLGFLLDEDPGVPYGETLEYSGRQLNFDRSRMGGEGPDHLGYSSDSLIGTPLMGNTRDICARRADELVAQDSCINIVSTSLDVVTLGGIACPPAVEVYWLAGKQRRVPHNMHDYPVWPLAARPFVESHLHQGGRLHVEGEYVSPELLSDEEQEWWQTLER